MVNINLLPWRTALRSYERKQCKIVLGASVTLSLTLMMLSYAVLLYQIHQTQNHIAEIRLLLQQAVDLHNAMHTPVSDNANKLSDMRKYQTATAKLIVTLGKVAGKQLCFNTITRQNGRVTVNGGAVSSAEVLTLMRQWSLSPLFSEVKIIHLRQQRHVLQFRMQALEAAKFKQDTREL